MLLYVAGPYSGDVRRNIARAGLVAARLWDLGHTVICPHLNTARFELITSVANEEFVERDLEIVRRCDGMVMAPGWQRSDGAQRERLHALAHGKPVWEWPQHMGFYDSELKGTGPAAARTRALYHACRRFGLL